MTNVKIKKGFVWPGYVAWVPSARLIIVKNVRAASNRTLIAHELKHVQQHRKFGPLFYFAYVLGWALAGFRYSENWMEIEARMAERNRDMLRRADRVIRENGYE